MSYRSDVGILITLPNNVKSEEIIKKFENVWPKFKDDFEIDDTGIIGLVFFYISDVKWYEETFEEVKGIMDIVHNWDELYDSGGINFMRIGEEYEDIEEIINGDCERFISLERSMSW